MSLASLSFLLALFAVPLIECAWEDGDSGVDRPNGDLPSMPISLNSSDPPKQCASLCQSNKECVAWAYCVPNCGGQKDPSCFLKASITNQALNPCRVSLYITAPAMYFTGYMQFNFTLYCRCQE